MNKLAFQQHLHLLATTACQVLETAAFAFAELADTGEPDGETLDFLCEPLLAVRLEMHGPGHGTLSIAAPEELCCTLAADMTGLEFAEVNPEQAVDVLSEMANMIAGQWATEAWGEQTIVQLDVPKPLSFDIDRWRETLRGSTSVVLLVDDAPLMLDLQWSAAEQSDHESSSQRQQQQQHCAVWTQETPVRTPGVSASQALSQLAVRYFRSVANSKNLNY